MRSGADRLAHPDASGGGDSRRPRCLRPHATVIVATAAIDANVILAQTTVGD